MRAARSPITRVATTAAALWWPSAAQFPRIAGDGRASPCRCASRRPAGEESSVERDARALDHLVPLHDVGLEDFQKPLRRGDERLGPLRGEEVDHLLGAQD